VRAFGAVLLLLLCGVIVIVVMVVLCGGSGGFGCNAGVDVQSVPGECICMTATMVVVPASFSCSPIIFSFERSTVSVFLHPVTKEKVPTPPPPLIPPTLIPPTPTPLVLLASITIRRCIYVVVFLLVQITILGGKSAYLPALEKAGIGSDSSSCCLLLYIIRMPSRSIGGKHVHLFIYVTPIRA
jgi:hypothetical protein